MACALLGVDGGEDTLELQPGTSSLGSFSLKIMPLYHGRLNCNQLSRTQQPTLNIAPSLKLVKRLCICARSNVLYRVNLLWTQLYFMRTIEVL